VTRSTRCSRWRPTGPTIIAWSGALTALFAATIAVAQNDIKKVLAYSTVSQLGFMFLAVGSGRLRGGDLPHGHPRLLQGAAVPRLRLGHPRHARRAGHAPDGRLRKAMPVTAVTFIIGWLAIAGVPPFAGFWSKDEILLSRLAKSPALYGSGSACSPRST
jgi:NADH-quinone oxidoreductase subunit L